MLTVMLASTTYAFRSAVQQHSAAAVHTARRAASQMAVIDSVKARQIFDSRGNPTVEVDIMSGGQLHRASVPSGASTGAWRRADTGGRFRGRSRTKRSRAHPHSHAQDPCRPGSRTNVCVTGMWRGHLLCCDGSSVGLFAKSSFCKNSDFYKKGAAKTGSVQKA